MPTFRTPEEINAAASAECRDVWTRNPPPFDPALVVYEAADLAVAWSLDPHGAVLALSRLNPRQFAQQALAHTIWAEAQLGKRMEWSVVCARWTQLLIELPNVQFAA